MCSKIMQQKNTGEQEGGSFQTAPCSPADCANYSLLNAVRSFQRFSQMACLPLSSNGKTVWR